MDEYQLAQHALADLKTAVLRFLQRSEGPRSNAEVGRALGIYMGYAGGNIGHMSRTVLGLLEGEELVEQTPSGTWRPRA